MLVHLFFYINCLSNDVLCRTASWSDDTTLNPLCDKESGLSQQVKVAFEWQLDLKNQICWKTLLIFSSYLLILKCQDFVSKIIYSSSKIRNCHPKLVWKKLLQRFKFLRKHSWNFTRNLLWNQTFPSLFIAIIITLRNCSCFLYKKTMYTRRNLKH